MRHIHWACALKRCKRTSSIPGRQWGKRFLYLKRKIMILSELLSAGNREETPICLQQYLRGHALRGVDNGIELFWKQAIGFQCTERHHCCNGSLNGRKAVLLKQRSRLQQSKLTRLPVSWRVLAGSRMEGVTRFPFLNAPC